MINFNFNFKVVIIIFIFKIIFLFFLLEGINKQFFTKYLKIFIIVTHFITHYLLFYHQHIYLKFTINILFIIFYFIQAYFFTKPLFLINIDLKPFLLSNYLIQFLYLKFTFQFFYLFNLLRHYYINLNLNLNLLINLLKPQINLKQFNLNIIIIQELINFK